MAEASKPKEEYNIEEDKINAKELKNQDLNAEEEKTHQTAI